MVLDSLTAGQNEALIIRASRDYLVNMACGPGTGPLTPHPKLWSQPASLPLLAGKLPMARASPG